MVQASSQPQYLAVITAAAQAQNCPAPKAVVAALLAAEKSAKQQRLSYPVETLLGQWRLRFTTGTRRQKQGGITLSRGFYLPSFVQAQIRFEPLAEPAAASSTHNQTHSQIHNQLQVGALRFRLTGPMRYSSPKNLLAFDFIQMELSLLGRRLYRGQFRGGQAEASPFDQKPIAKLPFFSFFLITTDLIAARGRGGGLAIWARALN